MYKRILVIKIRHIGDVLLATPVFKILKEKFPKSYVAALVNKGTEAVLENNPFIDEIITFDRGIKNLSFIDKIPKEYSFLREIAKKDFDTTIDLTGGDRAGIISFFSGAKFRIGMKSKGFIGKNYLYTHLFEINGERHTVLQNLELLEKVGFKIEKPEIIINVSQEEKKWAKKLIITNDSEPKRENSSLLVHIHPTSRWLFKCWKDEYMAELIKWFISNRYRVVITSSPEEKEIKKVGSILTHISSELIWEPNFSFLESLTPFTENFLSHSERRIINLAGRLTLRQLIAVSSVCNIYFGIDTAPMHIAAALGKPTIALFGPSGAFHWGPWENEANQPPYEKKRGVQKFGKNLVIQKDWECIPCGRDGCGGSKISKCLFEITPEEVIDILRNFNYI